MKRRPRIAVTMGDPAGVGPEVALRALEARGPEADLFVVGSASALGIWKNRLAIARDIDIVDVGDAPAEPGRPTREGARVALEAIRKAAAMCLAEEADAMVTAPVSKAAISSSGEDFSGHTEYLAALTGCPEFVMMFVAGPTRIALATTHLPLAEVPGAITRPLLVSRIRTLARGLREWFGVAEPVIAVAALNPHAGESGRCGVEEDAVIAPAMEKARRDGLTVRGPFPADALFAFARGGTRASFDFDAALMMYHDQGTIPAKLLARGEGVNVTLGLPIVRTSVDHGTAFELAGGGGVDHRSMVSAVALAAEIAGRVRAGGGR